jgi:hypothetical protein
MKNFLELLATNLSVDIDLVVVPMTLGSTQVVINGNCIYDLDMQHSTDFHYSVPLLEPIEITVFHTGATVPSLKFDRWESRPTHGQEATGMWKFTTDGLPFYQWQHHATAQGWLLEPTGKFVSD